MGMATRRSDPPPSTWDALCRYFYVTLGRGCPWCPCTHLYQRVKESNRKHHTDHTDVMHQASLKSQKRQKIKPVDDSRLREAFKTMLERCTSMRARLDTEDTLWSHDPTTSYGWRNLINTCWPYSADYYAPGQFHDWIGKFDPEELDATNEYRKELVLFELAERHRRKLGLPPITDWWEEEEAVVPPEQEEEAEAVDWSVNLSQQDFQVRTIRIILIKSMAMFEHSLRELEKWTSQFKSGDPCDWPVLPDHMKEKEPSEGAQKFEEYVEMLDAVMELRTAMITYMESLWKLHSFPSPTATVLAIRVVRKYQQDSRFSYARMAAALHSLMKCTARRRPVTLWNTLDYELPSFSFVEDLILLVAKYSPLELFKASAVGKKRTSQQARPDFIFEMRESLSRRLAPFLKDTGCPAEKKVFLCVNALGGIVYNFPLLTPARVSQTGALAWRMLRHNLRLNLHLKIQYWRLVAMKHQYDVHATTIGNRPGGEGLRRDMAALARRPEDDD